MTQPSAGGVHPKPRKHVVKKTPDESQATKRQIEITHTGDTRVVNAKIGPLTIFDKLKAYYHTLITIFAAILVLLNTLLSATHFIPGYGTAIGGYVSFAIIAVTAIVNFLKSNEVWVNKV